MKRVVICADGTWNKPDQKDRGRRKPSNVVKVARAVRSLAADATVQVVYYHEGVGTNWGMDKYIGGGFGRGLSKNVLQAYRFLIHNLHEEDELYLFGFSRGAYTVRSLVGLIEKIGLLPKDQAYYMPEAYQLYRDRAAESATQSFCREHHVRRIEIRCLGVWDTVGALGIPLGFFTRFNAGRFQFHDVGLASCVKHAYQAIAIDEQRKAFTPAIWDDTLAPGQVLEQQWFAGVHTNIGGGYEHDGLANCALHWLVDRARALGLEVDEKFLAFYKPYPFDELRVSRKGIYKLMGKHVRPIGRSRHGNESVHPSALERFEAQPRSGRESYAPPNLVEYLKQNRQSEP